MGTKDKLIERIKQRPVDFTFDEAKRLMSLLGYDLSNKGKTSGSREIFYKEGRAPIMLHRPHPENSSKALCGETIIGNFIGKRRFVI